MADELEKGVAGPRRYLYHELALPLRPATSQRRISSGKEVLVVSTRGA
jgi:hypothetical protein